MNDELLKEIQKIVDERLSEARENDLMYWSSIEALYGCKKLANVNGDTIERRELVAFFQNRKLAEKFASNCIIGDDAFEDFSRPRGRNAWGAHLTGLLSGYDYYQIETVEINPTQEKLKAY